MGLAIKCPRCSSRMIIPRYNDEPMYCMVCGAQGDTAPPTPKTTKYSETQAGQAAKVRASTTYHTARYREVRDGPPPKELRHMIVRYRLAHGDRQLAFPALIVECPWCGGSTQSQAWAAPRREYNSRATERYMYIECPSKHTYSIGCDASGEYYWR